MRHIYSLNILKCSPITFWRNFGVTVPSIDHEFRLDLEKYYHFSCCVSAFGYM